MSCRWFLRAVFILPFLFVFASCSTIAPHFSSQALPTSGIEASQQVIEVMPDGKNVFHSTLTAWERRGKVWRRAGGLDRGCRGHADQRQTEHAHHANAIRKRDREIILVASPFQ